MISTRFTRTRLGLLGLTFSLALTIVACDPPTPPPAPANPTPVENTGKADAKPEIKTLPPITK